MRLVKIVVVSDSHGYFSSLDKILSMNKDADIVIHCGDSRNEIELMQKKYSDKMYYCVKGNCDIGSTLPLKITEKFGKYNFFITHGHLFNVKWTMNDIFFAAKESRADFLLFGHTHTPVNEYYDGIYIMNPGSAYGPHGTFGIIEIMDEGILTNTGRL